EGAWTTPTRAWKFTAEEPNPNRAEKWTFFVDAATRSLIHVRNEILYDDLNGTVRGLGSPGFLPDEASNPAASLPLPYMRVGVVGGLTTYADGLGAFGFTGLDPGPMQLTATVGPAAGAGRSPSCN